jgi:hypothetical protein
VDATKRSFNTMDEQRAPQPQGQVQIKADEKELQGEYSNLVMVHHNLEEFTLNFIYIFPNGAQGKLLKSMIVSPGHAKRIWRALGENIARYEAQFGPIKEAPDTPAPTVGFVQ